MISQIKGTVSKLTEEMVVIEVNGIFYELMIPSGLFEQLKNAHKAKTEILLFTINYIEAGDRKSYHYPRLIGFTNPVDKDFFQLFTTVSGLGFKKGLKSLTLPIKEIATAIENKNAATLSRLPGIGARLADKVIAELNGKMAKFALSKGEQPLTSAQKEHSDLFDEAIEVLMQLQYNRTDAEKMIERVIKDNPKIDTIENLISTIFSQETKFGKAAVK
ncbi:MAG: Holliday junction branch migration protein RuvA [Candidatus Zixiibacteriota bacterium]